MKFMTMIHETHRSAEPPMELFAAIGALQERAVADGTFVDAGGRSRWRRVVPWSLSSVARSP